MSKLLKNKKAVTLFELLAVVVILGVIAAIAVPTIGNLIENQREKAAIAEWTNIQEAASLYALDDDVVTNGDGEFSLEDLISANYLTNFDGEVTIYIQLSRGSVKIEDNASITFSSDTGELSINAAAVEIDGILVEGTIPPARTHDNEVIF